MVRYRHLLMLKISQPFTSAIYELVSVLISENKACGNHRPFHNSILELSLAVWIDELENRISNITTEILHSSKDMLISDMESTLDFAHRYQQIENNFTLDLTFSRDEELERLTMFSTVDSLNHVSSTDIREPKSTKIESHYSIVLIVRSGSKCSNEEWDEYIKFSQVRTNETPLDWMKRI
ncbi:hypothetical protein Glove_505g59 [Diversispora epigaea]|uniref:Uncharacterized protein n=1 Tax=Diversispora epigaea TaxID=1348612 RepID=A0A397GM30_9GLOM|nr:hypothetical protein Glove_505g59 [Diversispora epigaea]